VDSHRVQTALLVTEQEGRVDERVGVEELGTAGQAGDVVDVGRHVGRAHRAGQGREQSGLHALVPPVGETVRDGVDRVCARQVGRQVGRAERLTAQQLHGHVLAGSHLAYGQVGRVVEHLLGVRRIEVVEERHVDRLAFDLGVDDAGQVGDDARLEQLGLLGRQDLDVLVELGRDDHVRETSLSHFSLLRFDWPLLFRKQLCIHANAEAQ
jgi:hypothetical protein